MAIALSNLMKINGYNNRMTLVGDQWTTDTTFKVYGQTTAGNGTLANGTVTQPSSSANLTNNIASLNLTSQLNNRSAYLIWAKNSLGTSVPLIANIAEARFLLSESTSFNKVVAGDIIHVYGINFSKDGGQHTDGSNVWIWFTDGIQGHGQFVAATYVDPYEIKFVCPGVASGTYQVWITNGHGGKYRWSAPLSISVGTLADAGVDYGIVYNLSTAPGNNGLPSTGSDGRDLSAAINYFTAIIGAGSGTILFDGGAGNYYLNSKVVLTGSKVWIEGATGIVVLLGAGFNDTNVFIDTGFVAKHTKYKLDCVTGPGTLVAGSPDGAIYGFRIIGGSASEGVTIDSSATPCYCATSLLAKVSNCTLKGRGLQIIYNDTTYGWIDSNTFYAAQLGGTDVAGPIVSTCPSRTAITNNTFRDLIDNSQDTTHTYTVDGSIDGTTKTFTVPIGLNYTAGMPLLIVPTDSPLSAPESLVSITGTVNTYNSGTGALSVNCISHRVASCTITCTASSGTFTLTMGGQTTSAIAFNAPLSGVGSIKAAIEALSNVGTGRTIVTGTVGAWLVNFAIAGLSGGNTVISTVVSTMTANNSGLTGGTTTIALTSSGAHSSWWIGGIDSHRGMGRCVTIGQAGASAYVYIANNTSIYTSRPPDDPNQNGGEQLAWESTPQDSGFGATPLPILITAATASTFTFPGITAYFATAGGDYLGNMTGSGTGRGITLIAYIINGTGVGQARLITAVNRTPGSDIATIDTLWLVIPDTTSKMALYSCAYKSVVYNNTIQGIAKLGVASCITHFEGCIEGVIDGNPGSNLSFCHNEASNANPIGSEVGTHSFNYYNGTAGTNISNQYFRSVAGTLGSVRRNMTLAGDGNTFAATGWYFVSGNYALTPAAPAAEVWEGGTMTDVAIAFDFSNIGYNPPVQMTLGDTTVTLGKATFAGSIGVDNPGSALPVVFDGTVSVSGFATGNH